jgi:amino acid transporter
VVTVTGAGGAVLALAFLYDETTTVAASGTASLGQVMVLLGALAAAMSSTAMIASLPESIRSRFRRPPMQVQPKPVYGFITVLAIGIGSTLGSPLFVLIPLNVVQYEFVSLGSLCLATVLSVLMAKVYAGMYVEAETKGLPMVGGPSFTRLACGTRSIRYFFSRVSMWIANTALAAYSKLVFVIFDLEILPGILSAYGLNGFVSDVLVYAIAIVFVGWSVLNAVFERRILRSVGYLQIVLTSVMVAILVYHSLALGAVSAWNLSGIATFASGNWVVALVINTGYLYLLFFGFQEIQALERDVYSETRIPIVSRIKKGFTMRKSRYLGLAMVLSVVVAAAVNILYALAVFSVHPSLAELNASQIPALYLAKNFLGAYQELLMAVAFLLATITTFVPAFLAASRHLSALGEDGYIPRSVSNISWVFTLVAIAILALGNANFLVEITDFLVLLSLGVITLSAIWIRGNSRSARTSLLPVLVGASCFVAGAAIYFINPSVVIFGIVSVAFTYLVFDVSELGVLGTNLFLLVFDLVCAVLTGSLAMGAAVAGPVLTALGLHTGSALGALVYLLMACALMLGVNLFVDVRILRRPRVVVSA